MRAVYAETRPEIRRKAELYNRHWDECEAQIAAALSDALTWTARAGTTTSSRAWGSIPYRRGSCGSGLSDVFYLNSEKGAIGMSIHEIIHFVWFDVWHSLFGDSFEEYERPNLKWILSEMWSSP